MQKLECEYKLFDEFKFAKPDIFLKVKPDSGSICKYEKLKLWHSCEIHLTIHDGNHELDFCDKLRYFEWKLCKARFRDNNIFSKIKYLPPFKILHLVKTALFVRCKNITFNCGTQHYIKINSLQEILDLILKNY